MNRQARAYCNRLAILVRLAAEHRAHALVTKGNVRMADHFEAKFRRFGSILRKKTRRGDE